jgi:hypothetical protein
LMKFNVFNKFAYMFLSYCEEFSIKSQVLMLFIMFYFRDIEIIFIILFFRL